MDDTPHPFDGPGVFLHLSIISGILADVTMSPLQARLGLAVSSGQLSEIAQVLANGADPQEACFSDGETAFRWAVRRLDARVLTQLVAHMTEVDAAGACSLALMAERVARLLRDGHLDAERQAILGATVLGLCRDLRVDWTTRSPVLGHIGAGDAVRLAMPNWGRYIPETIDTKNSAGRTRPA